MADNEQINDRTDEQNTATDENAEIQVNTEKTRAPVQILGAQIVDCVSHFYSDYGDQITGVGN